MEKTNKNRQVDKKTTFQVRIDKGWQNQLAYLKADLGKSFKELVEDALSNTYDLSTLIKSRKKKS